MASETKIKVGTVTVTEAREHVTHYECAAWYQTVRVEPGTYDVFAYPSWCDRKEGGRVGHSLYVEAEGKVTAASFAPLFAGNRIAGTVDRGPERIGSVERASWRLPTYYAVGNKHDEAELAGFVLDAAVVKWTDHEVLPEGKREGYTLRILKLA